MFRIVPGFVLSLYAFGFFSLYAQKTTTNLKNPNEIQTFLHVTEKIRCICLPSLPIQSCSYNMCTVSAYLKTFLENRIREGMTESEILTKIESGFGESALQDPVVEHFVRSGNQGMVDSIVYGFGPKILAKPDDTWINLTLLFLGTVGIFVIFKYGANKKAKKELGGKQDLTALDTNKIKEKIRSLEQQ